MGRRRIWPFASCRRRREAARARVRWLARRVTWPRQQEVSEAEVRADAVRRCLPHLHWWWKNVGGRGGKEKHIDLLLQFFTSLVRVLCKNIGGRQEVGRSVGRGGCGFDANSCLSNVVWTVLFCNLLTAAGQTHRPRWEKEKKTTTSVCRIHDEFEFLPTFLCCAWTRHDADSFPCFVLFSRRPAGRLCTMWPWRHVGFANSWLPSLCSRCILGKVQVWRLWTWTPAAVNCSRDAFRGF